MHEEFQVRVSCDLSKVLGNYRGITCTNICVRTHVWDIKVIWSRQMLEKIKELKDS